jgi:tetratricopeptide (TPR) repeat protein
MNLALLALALVRAEPDADNSFNLGYLYHVWGQAALGLGQGLLAREQFEKALVFRQETGSKADEAGRTMVGLSKAYRALELWEEARQFAQQAVTTLTTGLGNEHADTRKAVAWQQELGHATSATEAVASSAADAEEETTTSVSLPTDGQVEPHGVCCTVA